jgi:hypothetical protein
VEYLSSAIFVFVVFKYHRTTHKNTHILQYYIIYNRRLHHITVNRLFAYSTALANSHMTSTRIVLVYIIVLATKVRPALHRTHLSYITAFSFVLLLFLA